jgi:hypothetical protein
MAAADTVYGQQTAQTRVSSDTADNLLWDRCAQGGVARPCISFKTERTPSPLRRITELAQAEASTSSTPSESHPDKKTLVVFLGRSRRLAVASLSAELQRLTSGLGLGMSSSVPKTLGDVGAALVAANVSASLLVLQAAPASF